MVKDYPESKNINIESLGDNHSLVKMLNFIGEATTGKGEIVADFGCATGYFPALLKQYGYSVIGVEINPDAAKVAEEFCERVIVADLDVVSVKKIFPTEKFDVVTFGDVLEHLRDPWRVLKEVKDILKPNGFVVASIPNIAHGDIRLALLQGDFDYAPLGVLDNTHLRFFTKKTVESLFEETGYLIHAEETTRLPLLSGSNLVPKLDPALADSPLVEQLRQDSNSEILQFILKAIPATLDARHQALIDKHSGLVNDYLLLKKTSQELTCQWFNERGQLTTQVEELASQLNSLNHSLKNKIVPVQQQQQLLKTREDAIEKLEQQLDQNRSDITKLEGFLAKEKINSVLLSEVISSQNQHKQEMQTHLDNAERELLHSQHQLTRAELEIHGMKSSKFWRLRKTWFGIRNILGIVNEDISVKQAFLQKLRPIPQLPVLSELPTEVAPAAAIAPTDVPIANDPLYQQWLNQNYPTPGILRRLASSLPGLKYQPLISIVVPVYNTPVFYLRKAIDSVLEQIYPNWELCIADDASSNPEIKTTLEEYSAKDERIKIVFRDQNGHISLNSNSALAVATGEFIALLDHDDILTPDALYEIILLLNQHPEADMIYSDEDKIDDLGKLQDPFFKPDWCPDSFLSRMYTCHFGVYRREIIEQIGGFRVGYEGSQDYDLVLRFTERTEEIFHIPKILYHWRIHPQSAASCPDQKPYAAISAGRALVDALERRNEPGKVVPVEKFTGHYIIRYEIKNHQKVSIIIPTKDLAEILDTCLTSIFEKTSYSNYEVIVIDNGSVEETTKNLFSKWRGKEPNRFASYHLDIPFNYSKLNNFAVTQSTGDYLLFLNNDTEVLTPDWVTAMVEQAQRPSIGAVGALLLYPDDTVQHAGVILGVGGVANHSHKDFPKESPGYFGQMLTVNNYSAVTAACLMCRRDVFDEVHGFEEQLGVAFNDVDFCLKIAAAGYNNIYLPHVIVYHYESKSRGQENTPEKHARFTKEVKYMKEKWSSEINSDPCYNLNLSNKLTDYRINSPM
jgi:O-antigen biosynthesis protein